MYKRVIYIVLLSLGIALSAHAEVVVLRSGQIIKGDILLNNEEVVILRQNNGTRYQYPKTEVVEITQESTTIDTINTQTTAKPKMVALQLVASGGMAYIPHRHTGATMDVQAMVGSHNLLEKRVFLGGSIGYRGVFVDQTTYSWIPLQLVWQMPITSLPHHLITSSPHRPLVGCSLGYAFATNKDWGGGICAGLDIGWWYGISERSSLSLAFTAQWQQTRMTITETINQADYTHAVGCSILGLGIKLGLQF